MQSPHRKWLSRLSDIANHQFKWNKKELTVRRNGSLFSAFLHGVQNKVSKKSLRILGRNINQLRNAAGLSQDKLAVKADMTKRYVQMLESGQKCPSLATLKQLHAALKCTYDRLFDGV